MSLEDPPSSDDEVVSMDLDSDSSPDYDVNKSQDETNKTCDIKSIKSKDNQPLEEKSKEQVEQVPPVKNSQGAENELEAEIVKMSLDSDSSNVRQLKPLRPISFRSSELTSISPSAPSIPSTLSVSSLVLNQEQFRSSHSSLIFQQSSQQTINNLKNIEEKEKQKLCEVHSHRVNNLNNVNIENNDNKTNVNDKIYHWPPQTPFNIKFKILKNLENGSTNDKDDSSELSEYETAQNAYAAYKSLERVIPEGIVIKITPLESEKWNTVAEMMESSLEEGEIRDDDDISSKFTGVNQNESLEKGNLRSYLSDDEFYYNGGDEYDESMEDEDYVETSNMWDYDSPGKVHNTRSKKKLNANLNKKKDKLTSGQLKPNHEENCESLTATNKIRTLKPSKCKGKTERKVKFEWPLNAFGIFCSERYKRLTSDEEISAVQFFKAASEEWTSLINSEREEYEQKRRDLVMQNRQIGNEKS
ncbi:3413_t:CDS:2 [Diversispora eburnea]|uniref:3413_t:CDS:1 n=1 Tax=Diversispora eburnea TaxID=1213867 RepID=A0A9N9BLK1_9GLOM|nr:3413_t:CDS:2 [Diversispora eburnea]